MAGEYCLKIKEQDFDTELLDFIHLLIPLMSIWAAVLVLIVKDNVPVENCLVLIKVSNFSRKF